MGYSVTYALHIAHNYNQAPVFRGLELIGVCVCGQGGPLRSYKSGEITPLQGGYNL